MALRRDTARNLRKAFNDENAFADAVGVEIAAKRIKAKIGEKLIIQYYQDRWRVEALIEKSLYTEWF